MSTPTYDTAIIGAGAAGLFCAGTALARGRSVLVLDHQAEAGRKILISGGGRCNFTNTGTTAQNFHSENPHFAKSALAAFTAADFTALVAQHSIAYHEKTLGQLFADRSARDILAMLLARAGGASVRLGCAITAITRPDDFHLATSQGEFRARSLVVACGGLSIPKIGATGFAYEIAQRFGLAMVKPRPGLVPLTAPAEEAAWMQALAGVAFPAEVSCGKTRFREAALFTHRGLSGPAILQISSYWRPGEAIGIDMLPGQDAAAALIARKAARPRAALKTILAELLPARLAAALAPETLAERPVAELPNAPLAALGARINRFTLRPAGTEGYAKAEVTCGGVDTAGLSGKTLEARAVPGLYVVGEAVDVTGWLGGYNFQWAWSSGHAAGMAV